MFDAGEQPIGTFAIYRRTPHQPTTSEIEAATLMADAVAVAISRGIDRQKLIEARLQAEAANIAKSQFLANLNHEFRTPLNAIIGFSDLLGDKDAHARERVIEYAGIIGRSGRILLELIEGLLDLARIEAGRVSVDDEVFEVGNVLAECLTMLAPPINRRVAQIEVLDRAPGIRLAADRRAVIRMALNLIGNAVKFTPADGRIELVLEREGRGLAIRIRDNGPGIPPDDLPRLGRPFTRGTSAAARRVTGTGLGLFITKSLIELHDGSLSIRNVPPGGVEASIFFPAQRVFESEQ